MTSIGVFWLYQGKVLGQPQRQEEGVQGIPGLVDSTLEHAAVWEAQQCFRSHPACLALRLTKQQQHWRGTGHHLHANTASC